MLHFGKRSTARVTSRARQMAGQKRMTELSSSGMTRRALLGAFAATTIAAAPTYSNAAGFLRGGGDIRRIRMYSGRTGERIDMIYWVEGIAERTDRI